MSCSARSPSTRPLVFLFSDTQIAKEGSCVEDEVKAVSRRDKRDLDVAMPFQNRGDASPSRSHRATTSTRRHRETDRDAPRSEYFPSDERRGHLREGADRAKEQFGRAAGDMSPLQLYAYFIQRVKQYLHIIRAPRPLARPSEIDWIVPILVNCCAIDWFTAWPGDACWRSPRSSSRRGLPCQMKCDWPIVRKKCSISRLELFVDGVNATRRHAVTPCAAVESKNSQKYMFSTTRTCKSCRRTLPTTARDHDWKGRMILVRTRYAHDLAKVRITSRRRPISN